MLIFYLFILGNHDYRYIREGDICRRTGAIVDVGVGPGTFFFFFFSICSTI